MDGKGNDALLKTTRVTEWCLNNGGYVSLAFGGLLLLGCVVAYVIAVARGNVDAILPLISDAAGSPPQNGLFGTLICLGGMCGVVFMIQRYMIVLEKNKEKSSLVTAINKLSLVVGILSMLGITLITGYPINFYRNRAVWMMDVGMPHMIGGVMLFSLGLCYIALQCILTLFLKSKNEKSFAVRVLLLFICTSAFVYHMITVPEHFGGVSHLYYLNDTDNKVNYTGILPYPPTMGANLKIPIDTGGSYVASAIAQWIFVFFFCCFFFTFFKEAQEYSLLIVIETRTTHEPEAEDSKPDFKKLSLTQNGTQITKPAPETRKILRRDSTCQTMTDTLNDILSTKNGITNGTKDGNNFPAKADVTNGKSKILSNSEVDAKLTRLLSECESADDELKLKEIDAESSATTTVIENGTTTTASENRTITIDVESSASTTDTENNAITTAAENSATTGAENSSIAPDSENTKTGDVKEDLMAANGNLEITKEDAEKEEERIVIEQIDVAVKDEEDSEDDNKVTALKTDIVEAQPSNCPMSVQ